MEDQNTMAASEPNNQEDVREVVPANSSRRKLARQIGVLSAGLAVAGLGSPSPSAVAQTEQAKHPNVELIERYYATYAQGDPEALRPFFTPDIVWRIPGHHSLSGEHRGVDQVLAFFGQLATAGFLAEPIALCAGGDWVIDLHRGWNTQGPARIDIVWALAFRIQDGKIAEAINFPSDQHVADAFYLAQYPLKPLPDRLAGR